MKSDKTRRIIKAANIFDKTLNTVIAIIVITMFLFGAYSLYETFSILGHNPTPDSVMEYKPPIPEGNMNQDNTLSFEQLQKINKDVCAWITLDNTQIDYPVVQAENNVEYLNKSVTGENDISGSIFIDFRNKGDFSETLTILYGHNMSGEQMFGCIPSFKDKKEFDKIDSGYLFLPKSTHRIQVVSYIEATEMCNDLYSLSLINNGNAKRLVNYISNNSIHKKDISFSYEDNYILLSTCANGITNGRCILILKVIK